LKISTTRFGTIDIEKEQIIHMPSGLIGFPDARKYVLLGHREGSPFFWLQSVDNEALAFVLTDPLLFKPDYEIELSPEDIKELGLREGSNSFQTLVIVNISSTQPPRMTANLLGPIVISTQKRWAKQIVLYHKEYSHRHPIPLNGSQP